MTGTGARLGEGYPFGGLLLAMDTSGRKGSVALAMRTGSPPSVEVLGALPLAAEEEHAALLVPRIQDLLSEVGADLEELQGVVVGAGPGSFTGVRVAASTAKGMAWALDLPLWAFSSLAGAAAGVEADALRPRCVLFDARGDRVYAAAYRVAAGSIQTLLEPRATTISQVMKGLVPPGAVLMGDGAVRHRDLLGGGGNIILPSPAGDPSAQGLLRLLDLVENPEPLADPATWEPEYLRDAGAARIRKTRMDAKT